MYPPAISRSPLRAPHPVPVPPVPPVPSPGGRSTPRGSAARVWKLLLRDTRVEGGMAAATTTAGGRLPPRAGEGARSPKRRRSGTGEGGRRRTPRSGGGLKPWRGRGSFAVSYGSLFVLAVFFARGRSLLPVWDRLLKSNRWVSASCCSFYKNHASRWLRCSFHTPATFNGRRDSTALKRPMFPVSETPVPPPLSRTKPVFYLTPSSRSERAGTARSRRPQHREVLSRRPAIRHAQTAKFRRGRRSRKEKQAERTTAVGGAGAGLEAGAGEGRGGARGSGNRGRQKVLPPAILPARRLRKRPGAAPAIRPVASPRRRGLRCSRR